MTSVAMLPAGVAAPLLLASSVQGASPPPVDAYLVSGWCHQFSLVATSFTGVDPRTGNPRYPLTDRSRASLDIGICPVDRRSPYEQPTDRPIYDAPMIVRNGTVLTSWNLNDGTWRGFELSDAGSTRKITLALAVDQQILHVLKYSVSFLPIPMAPGVGTDLNSDPTAMGVGAAAHQSMGNHGNAHLAESLQLLFTFHGAYAFPTEGLAVATDGLFVFDVSFPCTGFRPRRYQTAMVIKLTNFETGEAYRDLQLPFTKVCSHGSHNLLHKRFGTPDDMGHLGVSLPLATYSILLLTSYMSDSAKVPFCMRPVTLPQHAAGKSGGILDALVLLLSGIIGFAWHLYTLLYTMAGPARTHEMFHVVGHGFMSISGMLSLSLPWYPAMINVAAPLYLIIMSFLFSMHSQHELLSAAVHGAYSTILMAFGVARAVMFFDPRFCWVASFLGLWAALTFQLSSAGAIQAELEVGLDAAAVAMGGGAVSASFCLCVIWFSSLCFGVRSKFGYGQLNLDEDAGASELTVSQPKIIGNSLA